METSEAVKAANVENNPIRTNLAPSLASSRRLQVMQGKHHVIGRALPLVYPQRRSFGSFFLSSQSQDRYCIADTSTPNTTIAISYVYMQLKQGREVFNQRLENCQPADPGHRCIAPRAQSRHTTDCSRIAPKQMWARGSGGSIVPGSTNPNVLSPIVLSNISPHSSPRQRWMAF